MSLLKTRPHYAPSTSLTTEVAAPGDLAKGLGIMRRWQVRQAGQAAKKQAAIGLAEYSAQVSADVGRQAIELKASEIKGALVGRAVSTLSAIGTEMIGRYGQAKLQMRAVHGEAFKGEIGLRHEFLVDMEQLAAQGLLTPDELAEAKAIIEQDAAEDIDALRNATRRGMEAIDAHVARATDHIAKQGNSY